MITKRFVYQSGLSRGRRTGRGNVWVDTFLVDPNIVEEADLLYNWVPVMNANKEHLGFVQLIGATGEVEWKRTIIS